MSYKAKQLLKSEIRRLRFKADQKTREAKRFNDEADELEKNLEKLNED